MYTQEEYIHLKTDYLLSWTDEQLQTRKEEVIHLLGQVPEYLTDEQRNPAYSLLNCQYHDVDEEQDTRAYYVEHPSPTRAEFNAIQQRINA